ncbi:hypothetical protein C8Q73DRAFT_678709 [Cubamyces lactineus]|nr:hypothetical protein C8Q73DRAFT_678709 [Cubamyces lactineus]
MHLNCSGTWLWYLVGPARARSPSTLRAPMGWSRPTGTRSELPTPRGRLRTKMHHGIMDTVRSGPGVTWTHMLMCGRWVLCGSLPCGCHGPWVLARCQMLRRPAILGDCPVVTSC